MNDVKSLRFGAAFDTTGTGVYVPSKQWMERTENRWCNRKGVYQPSHMYFILEDEAGSLYPALYPWRHNTSDSFARFAYKKYSKKRLNFFKCILSVHRCQRRRNSTVVFWKFQLQIDLSHSFHWVVARKTWSPFRQVCCICKDQSFFNKRLRLLEIERMTGMEFLGDEDRVRRVALRSTMNVEGDLDWAFKEPSSSTVAAFALFLPFLFLFI